VEAEESGLDNIPYCGVNQNLYRQQTWGDINKEEEMVREVGKGRGLRDRDHAAAAF
jgi:hypothetical protein